MASTRTEGDPENTPASLEDQLKRRPVDRDVVEALKAEMLADLDDNEEPCG